MMTTRVRLRGMTLAATTVLTLGTAVALASPTSAASHTPTSGLSRLCSYSTFEATGVDGYLHQYRYTGSSPIPGGGREASWRAYHNTSGGWSAVGYVSRAC
jgi:hypothetical protein